MYLPRTVEEMVATTFAPRRPAQWDVAGGELVLRISGSSRDGQVVRLRSAKCTIGSGRNCTLRLRAHGVAPLHCLVLRGPAATVVRRWSADTRLNQQFFSDALLAPGDRLGIGPIELEVLEVGMRRPPMWQTAANRPATDGRPQQEQAQRRLDQQREQLAAQSAQLDAQRSALAAERASFESSAERLGRAADAVADRARRARPSNG